ncbi:TonB-dependent siderophore receptor [Loktanella sp. S4079]|uniref:TonB-dependent siderophore receptor n=1 Tax=Loktanella sp. S4079 TaxID=579483 RepID=UPI000B03C248|nr:TonB-dependent siderophore receptor [Loktanella sp. S4079]
MTHPRIFSRAAFLLATTALFPVSAIAQETDETGVYLGVVVIDALNDGGEGVTATEAMNTAGARVAVDPKDLPRAMTIVPSEYFETRGARTMEATLSYTPGVVTETYGQDGRYDEYVIRGFEAQQVGTYRDGMPLRTVDWASWRTEPFALDSVNVLRGPTSDLYGMNEPGGLVNGVSKRPSFSQGGEARFAVASDLGAQVGVDYTAPLSDTLAYRIVGLADTSETNYDDVETSRVYLAPSLTWEPSDETRLTVYGQYQQDEVGDTYILLPQYGTQYDNPYGQLDENTYTGNPDYNTIESTQNYLGYEFEQAISDRLTWTSRARYATNDWLNETSYPGVFLNGIYLGLPGTSPDPAAVDTAVMLDFYVDQTLDQFSADNALTYEFGTAHGIGSVAVGVDHYTVDSFTEYSFGYGGELNIYTGETTNVLAGSFPASLPSEAQTDIRQTGLYVAGIADVGPQTKISGGLRYDDVEYSRAGYQTGLAGVATFDYNVEETFVSGNIGVSHALSDELSLYGAIARSFNVPPAGVTDSYAALDLEESQSFEAGLKYISADGATDFNLGVFQVEKQNATYDDPNSIDPTVMTQVGSLRSRGIEVEAIHSLDNGLSLFGTLAYIDAKVVDDPTYGGNQVARVPELSATLYAQYELQSVDGLSIGGGARFTGERYADISNTYDLDSVTLFDASITYEWNDWTAQLTARNLMDERYVAFCTGTTLSPGDLGAPALNNYSGACTLGEGRDIALTFSRPL